MQSVEEILGKLETADNTTKNRIENILVDKGKSVVPELVHQLQVVRGVKRGVVAMTLIRIGEASVEYLKKAANNNKDFEWVAKYLISEISSLSLFGERVIEKIKVEIYTDGACSGNPGPGGYGTILVHKDANGIKHEKELSEGFKCVTNNQMELLAVITGLEALKKPCSVTLYSDSKYVVDAFNNHWIDGWIKKGWKTAGKSPVKNVDLWKRLLAAKEKHEVEFIWVKGHAGHEYNERCDALAVAAYKQDELKDLT